MDAASRVAVNTIAQYVKTVFSVVVSLYTSRIILDNLGISDFGIYDLVGGIIALFSFVNLTLSTTTQRYLSYHQGKNDLPMSIKIFNNSFITQIAIAGFLCLLMLSLTHPIFDHLLRIEPERIHAAYFVYYCMVATLFLNFLSVPYQALLIAHENIVYSSIVVMCESVLKIPVAFSLAWAPFDRLEWYALCVLLMFVPTFFAYYIYCRKKYVECQHVTMRSFDKNLFKEMFSFTGWTLYGTACVVGRNRGLAIIINNFFTTAMNGAMGIGNQVSGYLSFLSTSLTNSMRPQIVKAEGAGNRKKMLRLSEICCKASLVLMTLIAMPAIFEMDDLMALWLVDVPAYAVFFARAFVLSAWIDQFTVGLSVANAAVGNVKAFQVVTNTVKVLALPVIIVFLKIGFAVEYVMAVYILFEIICSCIRLFMLRRSVGLSIKSFGRNVVIPLIVPILATGCACFYLSPMFDGWKCLFSFVISPILVLSLTYVMGLKEDEKSKIIALLSGKIPFIRIKQS